MLSKATRPTPSSLLATAVAIMSSIPVGSRSQAIDDFTAMQVGPLDPLSTTLRFCFWCEVGYLVSLDSLPKLDTGSLRRDVKQLALRILAAAPNIVGDCIPVIARQRALAPA